MTRRRAVLLGVLIVLALVGGAVPSTGSYLIRARVLDRLGARLGRRVSATGVRLGWGRVVLRGLRVEGGPGAQPPLEVDRIEAHFRWAPLLGGRLELADVVVERPRLRLVRGGQEDNVSAILDRLRARGSTKAGGGDPRIRRIRVDQLRIVGGLLDASDGELGTAHVDSIEGEVRPDGQGELRIGGAFAARGRSMRAVAERVTVALRLEGMRPAELPTLTVEGGGVTPLRGLTLTGIAGTVRPDPAQPERAVIEVHGSYGGSTLTLWTASGWLLPAAREGKLLVEAKRFRLSQLAAVLDRPEGAARILDAHQAEVDARLDLAYAGAVLDFSGSFHLAGLTVAHPMLASVPVPRLGLEARGRGRLDVGAHSLELTEAKIDFRRVHATLTASVANLGPTPRIAATLKVLPMPCQVALEALPAELIPNLQGFRLAGTFTTDLHFGVDLGDLEVPVDLGGRVGMEGCKALEAPEWPSAARLRESFLQTVQYEPGKWMSFFAGPENPDWTPYAEISPHLIGSIMTTEDNAFFRHRGFIPSEFRTALQQNLQRGYFRLGASSITMQTVKNVLLSREKTLSRKLQEMFLTWYLEGELPKERILEIYFNVIEFGPGIYGIGRAARHYFGKAPGELEPREAVFFSSILPNPKRRYVQYCRAEGQVDAKWDSYLKRILRRMHERGRIDDPTYAQAIAEPLRFDRSEAKPEKECLAMVKRITTPPGMQAAAGGTGVRPNAARVRR